MTQRIRILDKTVTEKIAAGEVVENPSSVVKELLENSMDAGATIIEVEIERGGKDLIRVVDNGEGIEREDVDKAFLRHATSKLSSEEELLRLSTLGFRGEALAAIAAVSVVSLTTSSAAFWTLSPFI
jgi:DNA mismatch repair protein MutL